MNYNYISGFVFLIFVLVKRNNTEAFPNKYGTLWGIPYKTALFLHFAIILFIIISLVITYWAINTFALNP